MAGRAVGGAAGAGCGIFSLVGILLGVGLTVFLASQVTGDLGGSGHRSSTTIAGLPDISDATVPGTPFGGATLEVATPTHLDDGTPLRVTGLGYPSGPVEVTTCLTRPVDPADGRGACDAATTVRTTATATADGTAGIRLDYPARRVITVDGVRYDCAATTAGCSLLAHPTGAFDEGPTVHLAFADGLPKTDAESPPVP